MQLFSRLGALLLALLFFQFLPAQEAPFRRGVNLTGWFQAGSPRQIQFTRYTRTDFEQIRSLGCDVIRLPINLHYMTGGAPEYKLDPLFLRFLDEAVGWAEALGLHLILDNHSFDPAADTDPGVGTVLEKVWAQMAAHYKGRSDRIYYEVLNEPHGISDALWNSIQQNVIRAIRTVDTTHTIIVGPAGWNSYNNLALMPAYTDKKLIYTFHFYDPFLFTHQGATWTDPSMLPLANVPFPYQSDRMPAMPASLRGSWIESAYNNYRNEGTVARVKQLIDIAVQFSQARKVPVFCGELGVYIPNSNNSDRVFWYETVRKYLEEKKISWTSWDYHYGFGLFRAGGSDLFGHDLNVPLLQALGLNVPAQTPYVPKPDTEGFSLYTDYIGNGIFESSYGSGTLDYYSENQAQSGDYCISWNGSNQYGVIGLDFRPDRDLSYLVDQGYVLDLYVRGSSAVTSFDLRFIDTKTGPADRPWRRSLTINSGKVPWDNQWHRLRIPLRDIPEQGAWDDNTWFNPQGKFDWKAVDRFEIVAEQRALQNIPLWFDQIRIADAALTGTEETGLEQGLRVYPNPAGEWLTVQHTVAGLFTWQLMDGRGAPVRSGSFSGYDADIYLNGLPSGLYLLLVKEIKGGMAVRKVIKR